MMLKMLVFSATHHFIDLCASKVRYYREGEGGGGGGSQAVNIYPQNSQTFLTLRVVVSPGRTLIHEGKETTARNRLLL